MTLIKILHGEFFKESDKYKATHYTMVRSATFGLLEVEKFNVYVRENPTRGLIWAYESMQVVTEAELLLSAIHVAVKCVPSTSEEVLFKVAKRHFPEYKDDDDPEDYEVILEDIREKERKEAETLRGSPDIKYKPSSYSTGSTGIDLPPSSHRFFSEEFEIDTLNQKTTLPITRHLEYKLMSPEHYERQIKEALVRDIVNNPDFWIVEREDSLMGDIISVSIRVAKRVKEYGSRL